MPHRKAAPVVRKPGARACVRFNEDPVSTPPRKLAHVTQDRFDERELLLPYDAEVIDAIKACRQGRSWASWIPERKVWQVPVVIWPCVRRALTMNGYEVHEDLAELLAGR